MKARKLSADAKDDFRRAMERLIDEKSDLTQRFERLRNNPHAWRLNLEKLGPQIEEQVAILENNIAAYSELLSNETPCASADSNPVFLRITGLEKLPRKEFAGHRYRGHIVLYKNCLYDVTGCSSKDEAATVVRATYLKERQNFDDMESSVAATERSCSENDRRPIPENVRIEVWRRDGGKCARCGSRENLEYDHIIPVAKGGSNTARNIELLCERCNRTKSDSIR